METEEFLRATQRLVAYVCAGCGVAKYRADEAGDERIGRRWSSVLRITAEGPDAFLAGIADGALRASDARANADATPVIAVSIHKALLEALTDEEVAGQDWVADLNDPDRWEFITAVPTSVIGATVADLGAGMREYFEAKYGPRGDRGRFGGGYL
jgi:hypothetical protein